MKQSDKNQEIFNSSSIIPGALVVLLFLSFGPVVIDDVWSVTVPFGHGGIVHHHRGHIRFSVDDVPVLIQSTHITHPALVKPVPHLAALQVYSALASIISTVIVQPIDD